MIVDDNVDAAESLAVLLEAQGHQVRVEAHPVPALASARQDPPEVFILDIGLPEMDGYELARRLRADPATGSAMFIALTGYGQAHDRILSKSSGFEHHFVKPMDTDRLGQVLAMVRERAAD
jgi:CheY-like chemotaxis protein